jgi:CHRD domain-containing protein
MKSILAKIKNTVVHLIIFSLFTIPALFISCGKSSSSGGSINAPHNFVTYSGTFMKTDSTNTLASGTVTGTFDQTNSQLTYSITWHSLTSTPIAMHFHDNGPVIITITGYQAATDQSMTGKASFSTTQTDDLEGGRIFVMIHTVNYPGGEIMAPLVKQ